MTNAEFEKTIQEMKDHKARTSFPAATADTKTIHGSSASFGASRH